jgi:UDP-N-acetylmuramoylalanine-D-glutamate ligase
VIDNGVSTTPDSTVSAVRSTCPGFTLLVGGKPKDLPLDELVEACRGHVRRVIVFGAAGEPFAAPFRAAGIETHTRRACARPSRWRSTRCWRAKSSCSRPRAPASTPT